MDRGKRGNTMTIIVYQAVQNIIKSISIMYVVIV